MSDRNRNGLVGSLIAGIRAAVDIFSGTERPERYLIG